MLETIQYVKPMLKVITRKEFEALKGKTRPKSAGLMAFFGKGKGIFGDGLKYQKKIRELSK